MTTVVSTDGAGAGAAGFRVNVILVGVNVDANINIDVDPTKTFEAHAQTVQDIAHAATEAAQHSQTFEALDNAGAEFVEAVGEPITSELALVFQGLTREQAADVWRPFLDWVEKASHGALADALVAGEEWSADGFTPK